MAMRLWPRRRASEPLTLMTGGQAGPASAAAPAGVEARLGALLAEIIQPQAMGRGVSLEGTLWSEMAPFVESEVVSSKGVFDVLAAYRSPTHNRLLDFGCGQGGYRAPLESEGWDWTGVDYLEGVAPYVAGAVEAQGDDPKVFFYDGRTLPFASDHFDVVFSMLVFEHVQHIDMTFAEIARVLKPGGRLVGMVAYLEPTHDFSTFNFTPIGLKVASERNGLALHRVYPAYDVFHFLAFRLAQAVQSPDAEALGSAFNDPNNALHASFAALGRERGLTPTQLNLLKLQFSTFVIFDVEKRRAGAAA